MKIKKISISNYKSFNKLEINLEDFNVIIGPNASGKSNFISIFKFFKDLWMSGIKNAISLQGSTEYIPNMALKSSKDVSMGISLQFDEVIYQVVSFNEKEIFLLRINYLDYQLHFGIQQKNDSFYIKKEQIEVGPKLLVIERNNKEFSKVLSEHDVNLKVIYENGNINYSLSPDDLPINIDDFNAITYLKRDDYLFQILKREDDKKLGSSSDLMLKYLPIFMQVSQILDKFFQTLSIYNIDPKISKQSTAFTGKTNLEENGQNLALVLNSIFKDKNQRKKFLLILKDMLPFIDDLAIQKLSEKTLLPTMKEIYYEKEYFPSYLLSDGTINITALIVILYFEKNPVLILEEPERNIHPALISSLIDLMKDVAKNLHKQIIITTHNPEIFKYAGLNNILSMTREDNGFSIMKRLSTKEEIQYFIKNELGLETLFIENFFD